MNQRLSGYFPRTLNRYRSLAAQAYFELTTSIKHAVSVALRGKTFRGKTGLKVNVGCGDSPLADWTNVDVYSAPNIFYWDCRRSLPFDDQSVDIIFAEHVYEHFDHPLETGPFLAECRRCLRPAGVLRIIVPDAGRYLSLFSQGLDAFVPVRPLSVSGDGFRDHCLGTKYETPMELINVVFRQGHEHKFAYDAETLRLYLHRAGFRESLQQQFGISRWAEVPPDKPERASESLYVEGIN